ncbi:MAG: hypothetical protein RLZ06_394 [Actinomycetota bacterium]|jgi:hypothetical protein
MKFKLSYTIAFLFAIALSINTAIVANGAPSQTMAAFGGDECFVFSDCHATVIDGGGGGGFTSKPCSGMCMFSIRL